MRYHSDFGGGRTHLSAIDRDEEIATFRPFVAGSANAQFATPSTTSNP
jgi:hypothetical protein